MTLVPKYSGAVARVTVACALALLGVAGFGATPASADEADPITWAVTPADEAGPDGRNKIELELEPGETAADSLAVRNLSSVDVEFALAAADGYLTPTGRFNMLPRDQESVDAGTWITVQESVTVAPGAVAVVPVSIAIPANATPGDHAAGIAASIYTQSTGGNTSVGVESRVGFRVMVRVGGTITPGLEVSDIRGDYDMSWNPFRPGSVTVSYMLHNTGNVRLAVEGTAGGTPVSGEDAAIPELLPGDTRRFTTELTQQWPIGVLSIPLVLDQSMVPATATAGELEPLREDVFVWAIPWSQLVVLLAVIVLIAAVFWRRRRRTAQIERLIGAAREEGRRAVEAEISGNAHPLPASTTTNEEA
jgi:hypothetical protein